MEKKRLTFKVSFKWFDFWFGWYWDRDARALYVCLLPMFPIRISVEKSRICSCGGKMKKIAVLDDGWSLQWECCDCGNTEEYEWPYRITDLVSGSRLECDGFELV